MRVKIFGQLRYDFLQLGWIMAIWAAWLLLDAVIGWERWHGSAGMEWHHVIVFFSYAVVPLIGGVLVLVLAPALAFGHSLWRSDAFWRTRPLSLRHVLWTRMGFLIAAFCLMPLAIRFAVLVGAGVESGLAFSNAFGYSLGFLAGAAVVWGFAMHFSGWRQLLTAMLGCVLLGFFLYRGSVQMMIFLAKARFDPDASLYRPMGTDIPDGFIESRFLIAGILLILAGAIAGNVLFRWRNRWIGFGTLGVALAVAIAIPLNWPANFFETKRLGTVPSAVPAWTEGPPIEGAMIGADFLWNEVVIPEENWLGLMEISTDYPLESGPLSTWRLQQIGRPAGMEFSMRAAFEARGIRPVLDDEEHASPLDGRIRFRAIDRWWDRPTPWTVSGEVQAHWFRHEIAGTIPLKAGTRFIEEGNMIVIDGVRLHRSPKGSQHFLTIELVADRVRAWFTADELWRTSISSAPFAPFDEWHLALVIPAEAEAESDGEGEGARYKSLGQIPASRFAESGARIHLPIFDEARPEVPPLITPKTLANCRLTILRPVYVETMVVPFAGGSDR